MEPISRSGDYCVLKQDCLEPIFCISALNCAKMRSLSYQISAYRARQYLPIEWGSICLKSDLARLLSAQIAAMEPITGSGAYCVLRQECQEPIFCMSALKCAKMRSLQYHISAYRAGQNLHKQRGTKTVICPNSGDGTYYGIRSLLCAQIGVPVTYFLHERIELCENALAIVPNICLQSEVVSAYRVGQYLPKKRFSQTVICPNSSDITYYGIRRLLCAQMGVPGTYSLHERIELCENALAIIPNICLQSEAVSAYRVGQNLPKKRGSQTVICPNSSDGTYYGIRSLLCAQIGVPGTYFLHERIEMWKMRSLQYHISAYRAGQNLHKQRGTKTVICPNSGDGTYYGIRSLLCAQMGVPGTYFLHMRIELCENALAIVPNICLQSEVISAYRAGRICINTRQPDCYLIANSSDGTYYVIRSLLCAQIGVPGTYFLHMGIELCENALAIVPNICLQSEVVSA